VLRRAQPLFGERFHLPTRRELDIRIISGPAIFIFAATMFAGMWLARSRRPSLSRIATPVDPLET
jgi:hypothetical protein